MLVKSVLPQKNALLIVSFHLKDQFCTRFLSQHIHMNDKKTKTTNIMTKKITALLTMLVCFVSLAWSQQVASTPTTELTTGFYVIKTMSDKTNNGDAYVYGDTSNKQVRSTNKSDAFPALEGTTLTNKDSYIWEVTANADGSIQIKNKSCGYYFGEFEQNSWSFISSNSYTIKQSFNVKTAQSLVSLPSTKNEGWFMLRNTDLQSMYNPTNKKKENHYIYVCANSKTELSYWFYDELTAADNASNTAKFRFYKVEYDVPTPVTVTYNYLMDGNVKKSVKYNCMTKGEFPNPTELPAYVSVVKPEGIVKDEDNNKTFNLDCIINLPFKTSDDSKKHYYYFQNSNDTQTRLFANGGSLNFRKDSQAENLNNVNGDLWYVTGNPFDGYKFHNVGANKTATSNLILSTSSLCHLNLGAATGNEKWYLQQITNNEFAIYANGCTWHYNNGSVNFKGNDTQTVLTDAAYAFTLTAATITLPLNYSEADDARFATTCLPYAVEVADAKGTVETFAGKLNSEKTELTMVKVNAVPANQGIIIKGASSDESVVLNVIDAAETIDNDLQGNTQELTDLTGVYSFGRANGDGKVGFFRSTNSTLRANRAFVKIDNSASQSIAMNFNGTVSSIESVNTNNATMSNAPVYDLTGRRVMKMVKGNLYIQNGKKFIAQ